MYSKEFGQILASRTMAGNRCLCMTGAILLMICQAIPASAQETADGWSRRAEQAMREGKSEQAIAELDNAILSMPKNAQLYILRGSVKFRSGKVKDSIPDFDKSVEIDPQVKPYLWQRGIALYYADRFEDGLEQFAVHREVNPNDVENAFWHYLCNVRLKGVEEAQKEVLLAGFDNRPPLMQVQQLIQGKLGVADVIVAAEKGPAGTERNRLTKFYGYLYVGLYFDATGDLDNAKKYLQLSLDQNVPSYMYDVAKVHLDHLTKEGTKKP
jgi:lipoprotein NlpI